MSDPADMTIRANGDFEIEFVHAIEKSLDDALLPMGFTRTTSAKCTDYIELNYRQFAVCGMASK